MPTRTSSRLAKRPPLSQDIFQIDRASLVAELSEVRQILCSKKKLETKVQKVVEYVDMMLEEYDVEAQQAKQSRDSEMDTESDDDAYPPENDEDRKFIEPDSMDEGDEDYVCSDQEEEETSEEDAPTTSEDEGV